MNPEEIETPFDPITEPEAQAEEPEQASDEAPSYAPGSRDDPNYEMRYGLWKRRRDV